MTIPTISTLPTAPARTDPPATFVTRADSFLAALVVMQGELNTSIGAMNTDIAGVNADATAAANSATAAAASATAAANAAGAALWVSGQAYAEGDAAISGIDYQTYRAETATSGTTDPSLDANWTKISGVLPAESGNAGKFLTTDGSTASWAAIETGTITATASGALTNGCPVVINSNGTVSKTYRNQQTEATGSATDVFDITAGDNDYIASCYVPDTGDIWFCYSTQSDTLPIFRRISVNGTGISSGAANNQVPSQGTGGEGRYPQICYIGNSKVAIVFSANNDGNAGLCVIATVAGNGTATFGTPVEFVSNSQGMSVCYDSDNDKIVVVYQDNNNPSFGKAVIGTVSGTSVTFGTPVNFQNSQKPANKFNIRAIYIPEQQLIVCQYKSVVNTTQGFIESFSSDGTTLTNVDQAAFSGSTPEFHDLVYAPDRGVLMIVWTDQNDSDNGKARTYTFYENKNFNPNGGGFVEWDNGAANNCVVSYDQNAGWFYLVYTNLNQSSYPYRKYIKMNSANVPYDTNTEVLYSSNTTRNGLTYDPVEQSHCFIGYQNAAAHQIGYDVTNLQLIGLGSNYIGISNADYADGATATVQIVGAVDDAQTGLTTGQVAYARRDGTISSTADTPNVVAGTAISATRIIVKG